MRRWRTWALALALAGLLSAGLLHLFEVEFAGGELYPKYSSLRTDPEGAKLLYASLGLTPGLEVTRNYLPLESLEANGASILVLSADPLEIGLQAIEKIATRGNRVVVSMDSDLTLKAPQRFAYRKWQLKLPNPGEIGGQGLYFKEAAGWTVLDRAGDKLLAVERPFGKGSIVLFARSQAFSNQSTAAADTVEEVTAALGPAARVIFDESHLGIAESGSVVGIARRFRLTGLAAGLALLAALFIWRNAGAFPPAPAGGAAARPGAPVHGLEALLRRHIAPRDLAAACWKEWSVSHKRDVPEEKLRRAAAIAAAGAARPLQAATEIHAVLHSKGEL